SLGMDPHGYKTFYPRIPRRVMCFILNKHKIKPIPWSGLARDSMMGTTATALVPSSKEEQDDWKREVHFLHNKQWYITSPPKFSLLQLQIGTKFYHKFHKYFQEKIIIDNTLLFQYNKGQNNIFIFNYIMHNNIIMHP
ncbi:hypothetical protein ACJX0J_031362, partial [Zea mays]